MSVETFSLQSQELSLCSLWNREPVELWSAGAGVVAAPPGFAFQEGHVLLVRGRLRLDPDLLLEGPALVVLDPGAPLQLEALDPNVRLLLWSIHSKQPRLGTPRAPRVSSGADLEQPRTVTTGATLGHWLPLQKEPARRTLAGSPTLVLNLGHAALPLVAGRELLPLAGGSGAVTNEVVTLSVRPGSGPLLAIEQIELPAP